MDNQAQPDNVQDAQLNDFGRLAFKFAEYGQNASNNLQEAFSNMTTQQWLRLVMIVGGYILFRTRFMTFMSKRSAKQMEEDDAKEQAAKAKLSPNQLRTGKTAADLDDEDADQGDGTGADWGLRARNRQKRVLKQLWEAEEQRKQAELEADKDDKDIAEFLED